LRSRRLHKNKEDNRGLSFISVCAVRISRDVGLKLQPPARVARVALDRAYAASNGL
jgi:hypothetical protein